LTSSPSEARIAVSDTGIGIPETNLPYVFERFFRSDRARRAHPGGSGLGLSIVRWIVEAHKGKVEVASRVGEGTTFTVTLPLVT
jgi:signal transduction histidine kinase